MKWLTHDDLKQMKPETVELLRAHGDIDHLDEPAGDTRITLDDLKQMSPEAVIAARKAGDLDHLLKPESGGAEAQAGAEPAGNADQGARGTPPRTGRERLRGMSPAQIVAARRAGELDALLKGEVD